MDEINISHEMEETCDEPFITDEMLDTNSKTITISNVFSLAGNEENSQFESDDSVDEPFLTVDDSDESIQSEPLDDWSESIQSDSVNDNFLFYTRQNKMTASMSKFLVNDKIDLDYKTKIGNSILEKVKFKMTRNCSCLLRCPECKTCVHRFKGSLIDYSFPFHVCRHIRVVPHTYLGESVELHGNYLKVVVRTNEVTGQRQEVNLPIINRTIKSKGEDLEMRKSNLTDKFLGLLNTVNDVKHFEYFEREANKLDLIHQMFLN